MKRKIEYIGIVFVYLVLLGTLILQNKQISELKHVEAINGSKHGNAPNDVQSELVFESKVENEVSDDEEEKNDDKDQPIDNIDESYEKVIFPDTMYSGIQSHNGYFGIDDESDIYFFPFEDSEVLISNYSGVVEIFAEMSVDSDGMWALVRAMEPWFEKDNRIGYIRTEKLSIIKDSVSKYVERESDFTVSNIPIGSRLELAIGLLGSQYIVTEDYGGYALKYYETEEVYQEVINDLSLLYEYPSFDILFEPISNIIYAFRIATSNHKFENIKVGDTVEFLKEQYGTNDYYLDSSYFRLIKYPEYDIEILIKDDKISQITIFPVLE